MAGMMSNDPGFFDTLVKAFRSVQEDDPEKMKLSAPALLGATGGSIYGNLIKPGIDAADYIGGEANRMLFGDQEESTRPIDPQKTLEAMTEVGLLGTIGGGLMGPKSANVLSTFGGQGAKNFPKEMLPKAIEMRNAGVDAPDIWKETGLAMGQDGKWRFEINDRAFDLKHDPNEIYDPRKYYQDQARSTQQTIDSVYEAFGEGKIDREKAMDIVGTLQNQLNTAIARADQWYNHGGGTNNQVDKLFPLNEAINHKGLMENYPQLGQNTDLSYSEEMFSQGSWNPETKTIDVSLLSDNPKSTALHELQHNIQSEEGFARGGNVDSMVREVSGRQYDIMNELEDIENAMVPLRNMFPEQARKLLSDKNLSEKARLELVERGLLEKDEPFDNLAAGFYIEDKNQGFKNLNNSRKRLQAEQAKLADSKPHEMYQNLMGEAEARAVQDRRFMSDEDRRANFPEYLGRNDLIVRGESGIVSKSETDRGSLIRLVDQLTQKINDSDVGILERKNLPEWKERKVIKDQLKATKKPTVKKEEKSNFDKWFEGSAIVDEQGKPLTVYHGTGAKGVSPESGFSFDYGKIGSQGRSEGPGFYFTQNKRVAEGYGHDGSLLEGNLSIKKPLKYDDKSFNTATIGKILKRAAELEAEEYGMGIGDGFLSNYGDVNYDGLQKVLKEAAGLMSDENTALDQIGGMVGSGVNPEHVNRAVFEVTGHDGVIAKGFGNQGDIPINVAFFPEQFKALNNKGTYDPNDPNIFNAGLMGIPRDQSEKEKR